MAENHEIVKVDVRQIAKGEDIDIHTWDGNIIQANVGAIQSLLPGTAKGTKLEVAAFLAYCQAKQLDPFSKQVYFIKYKEKDPPSFVTSWEVFMARAARHPQFDGMEAGIIWRMEGVIERGQPCDYAEDAQHVIVGGWAKVYRKDREVPVYVEVPLGEMEKHKYDGTVTAMWRGQKTTMCVKVPKARALRQAFADDLGGLYTDAEPIVAAPDSSEAAADVPTREERAELPAPEPEATPQQELAQALAAAIVAKNVELSDAETAQLLASLARTTMGEGDAEYWAEKDNWTDEVCQKVQTVVQQTGIPDDLLPQAQQVAQGEPNDIAR